MLHITNCEYLSAGAGGAVSVMWFEPASRATLPSKISLVPILSYSFPPSPTGGYHARITPTTEAQDC